MMLNSPSLIVFIADLVVFQSEGKWLFPLFDLEDYLMNHPVDMKNAHIHDKVVGKAAALLMVRLGVGQVHGVLMSDLASQVFETWEIPYSFDQRVERIDCQTEAILQEISDPEIAYKLLSHRAKRS
jgi:hypothetical protein